MNLLECVSLVDGEDDDDVQWFNVHLKADQKPASLAR